MDTKKEITVFYSWQSGPHDKENRYLIHNCLRAAAKRLAAEGIAVRIERDTREESEAADIPGPFLRKSPPRTCLWGISAPSIIRRRRNAERRTPT